MKLFIIGGTLSRHAWGSTTNRIVWLLDIPMGRAAARCCSGTPSIPDRMISAGNKSPRISVSKKEALTRSQPGDRGAAVTKATPTIVELMTAMTFERRRWCCSNGRSVGRPLVR